MAAANGGRRCAILIDTAPYAREAETMLRRAVASGMTAVVVTEERNTWAAKHRPLGLFRGEPG